MQSFIVWHYLNIFLKINKRKYIFLTKFNEPCDIFERPSRVFQSRLDIRIDEYILESSVRPFKLTSAT